MMNRPPWAGLHVDIPTSTVDGPIKRSKSTMSLSDCFDEKGHQTDTCGHRYGGEYCPSSMVSFPRHSPHGNGKKKNINEAECTDAVRSGAQSPTSSIASCSGSEAEGEEDEGAGGSTWRRAPGYRRARTGAMLKVNGRSEDAVDFKDREAPPATPHTPTGNHVPASCLLSDGSSAMYTDADLRNVGLSHIFSTPSTDASGARRRTDDVEESPIGLPLDTIEPCVPGTHTDINKNMNMNMNMKMNTDEGVDKTQDV